MNTANHLSRTEQFRAGEANGEHTIEGYFSVFDGVYDMGGGWTESVDPHAFDDALRGADVRALLNHDTTLVLGRTTAGTLELRTDEHGLYGKIKINPADTEAMNAWARVQRGDVDQASFGFEIEEEEGETRADGGMHWIIKRVTLYEISVCTFPAYETTALTARHAERAAAEKRKGKIWLTAMKERMNKWH